MSRGAENSIQILRRHHGRQQALEPATGLPLLSLAHRPWPPPQPKHSPHPTTSSVGSLHPVLTLITQGQLTDSQGQPLHPRALN